MNKNTKHTNVMESSKKVLYHITRIENKDKILKEGLIPNNGKIFLFEDVDAPYPEGLFRFDKWTNNMRLIPVSDIIAKLELMISDYSLFKVTTDLETFPDNECGEYDVMKYQYYVKKPIKDVEYLGDFTIGKFWDYELLKEKYHVPPGFKVVHLKNEKVNLGFVIQKPKGLQYGLTN